MLLLNYKPVLHQPTGIGIYANAVLPALQKFEHVLVPGGGSGGSKDRLKRLAWTQMQLLTLAKKHKADLIFTPAPEGYLGDQAVPQILMVHDLRPLIHPECSMQTLYFKSWVPPLLRQCTHILTNSEFTAAEINRCIGVSEDKITVTPLGYDPEHFYFSESFQRLHSRPYLLHIGQAYPHKNLKRLIQAFNSIAHRFPDVDLLLLGKPHPSQTIRLQQFVAESNLSDRVIFKSYVPYADLPNWYRGACAFVYPSLWEGFGLPILEAMACGCPVITSYGSGTQEVANNAAILIDPYSVSDLVDSITKILLSEYEQSNLRIRGAHHARGFNWTNTSKELSEVIAEKTAIRDKRHPLI